MIRMVVAHNCSRMISLEIACEAFITEVISRDARSIAAEVVEYRSVPPDTGPTEPVKVSANFRDQRCQRHKSALARLQGSHIMCTSTAAIAAAIAALVALQSDISAKAQGASATEAGTDIGTFYKDEEAPLYKAPGYSPYAGRNYPTRVLWG
jgi:hypothetical protein